MRFTTKTEYGLVALLYMTHRAREREVFTVREIVQNEHFSMTPAMRIATSGLCCNCSGSGHSGANQLK